MNEVDELIDFLMDILGVKCLDEDLQEHQRKFKFIYEFIISKFGSLTVPEIKEAFRMYVAKEFGHKDIFRVLDTIVVSDVLNHFILFRGEKLKLYTEKNKKLMIEESYKVSEPEKTKIMIDAVNNKFKEFIETNDITEPIEHIFQELVDRKILKMPTAENPNIAAYYDRKLLDAKIQVERELKSQFSISESENLKIKEELQKIINNDSGKCEIRAKKLVLVDYFTKQINLSKTTIL